MEDVHHPRDFKNPSKRRLEVKRPPTHQPTRRMLQELWSRLKAAPRAVLFLDYDGTLAPFHRDPYKAFPYPGVVELLNDMWEVPCRLVIVTGRAVEAILPLLKGMNPLPEIWANHGMEVLKPGGERVSFPVSSQGVKLLEEAKRWIDHQGWGLVYEAKPTSIAVHWRGRSPEEQRRFSQALGRKFKDLSQGGEVHPLPFDGGLELRVRGRTKGDVVNEVLNEEGNPPSAYLGDDITDEDAFSAMKGRGVGLLVRKEWRETQADGWLIPPEELLWFLHMWIMGLKSR